jgi:hypothetical protein
LKRILSRLSEYDAKSIYDRVNYYNKLVGFVISGDMVLPLGFKFEKKGDIVPKAKRTFIPLSMFTYNKIWGSAYFFDTYRYTRYFANSFKMAFRFGDVTDVTIAAIVKSRPVGENNANSVVLNLDKSHHFVFLKDKKSFESKKNKLIYRGGVYQAHRIEFFKKYFNNPLCDLGAIDCDEKFNQWKVEKVSIDYHLDYKFILCLEGNDVASNLKWVMSSNSLAVMPRPKYETWFMEGRLIPNYHYVEIKSDYSDVKKRLDYYIEHTGEALKIIENAHRWVKQFSDKKKEDLISVLVTQKYFIKTGQAN